MTKEQIIALVNAKIAGQGSAVDVGGALPSILTGLAEMAGNAVSPDSTDMTEQEQMQVRKNLGLYYEETTTGEKEVVADGIEESKLSNDTPAKEDILKVLNGDNELDFTFFDIEGGYLVQALSLTLFRVMEGDGIYTGSIWATSNYKLVYNGETTVVSKVPEKYLPVAWNQVVTEGTKIAELTIGEETTNVFAPEGGGGLEYVPVTSELVAGEEVNLETTYGISSDDYNSLRDGKKAGLVVESSFAKSLYMLLNGVTTPSFPIYNGFSVIGGNANTLKVYTVTGPFNNATITVSSVAMGTVPGSVFLSGLPDSSITTQSGLDAIGLTLVNINKLASGEATAIIYQNPFVSSKSSLGILYVNGPATSAPNDYSLGFRDGFNVYEISSSASQITVTVTPIS